jgi:hypothetical protein
MDTWAPVVRWAHDGVGSWTNDTGTLTLNTSGGPGTTQANLRPGAAGADTAAHDVGASQWTNAYGEVVFFPNNFSGNTGRKIGVWLRVADSSNCYTVVFDGGSGGTGNITISKVVTGTPTSLATGTFSLGDLTSFITVRAEAQDDIIRAFWRGQHILSVSDTTRQGPGFVSMFVRAVTTTGDVQAIRWEAGPLRPNYASPQTQMAGPRSLSRLR